jgi:hypothetical protein
MTPAAPRHVVRLADLRPEVRAVVMALLAQTQNEPAEISRPAGSETGVQADARPVR